MELSGWEIAGGFELMTYVDVNKIWGCNNEGDHFIILIPSALTRSFSSSMDAEWDSVLQFVADPADTDYRQPLQVPTPPVSASFLSNLTPNFLLF